MLLGILMCTYRIMKPYSLPLLESRAIKDMYSVRALLMDLMLLFKSLIERDERVQEQMVLFNGRMTPANRARVVEDERDT